MNRNCIKYRDTMAAPGSKLHEALSDKDMALAERIYQQCEKDARELVKPKVATPGVLRGKDQYSDAILELARKALAARDSDTRTDAEKIRDAADFICDTRLDLPVTHNPKEPTK